MPINAGTTGSGGFIAIVLAKRNRSSLPLLTCESHTSHTSPPLPACSTAIASTRFQEQESFLVYLHKFESRGFWFVNRDTAEDEEFKGDKRGIVLISSEHFLPNRTRKQGIVAFLLCLPQDPLPLVMGRSPQDCPSPPLCPERHYLTLCLSVHRELKTFKTTAK